MRLALVSLLLAACGGATSPSPDLAALAGTLCTDTRADPWQLPLTKSSESGRYQVTLLSADASPPIIGVNAWTMQVARASTLATAPALVTLDVKPWMPDHHHGTSVVPVVTSAGDAYVVNDLYFFMAGLWQTTLTIDGGVDASDGDDVTFSYCLAD